MKSKFYYWWTSPPIQIIYQVIWAGLIVFMPITSFPVLKKISGASTVAPPTMVLFLVMVIIWFVPYILNKTHIPIEGKLLGIYLVVTILSWLVSCFVELPSFRSKSILTEGPVAFLTLAMGLAAFFVSSAWLSSGRDRLRITLFLINVSGLVLLGWSLLQGIYVLFHNNEFPHYMAVIQRFISSRRDPLIWARVTGFAYEPSWLAHMLNVVYLPIWISATLQGFSAHKIRLWRITFENFLLIGGVAVLFLSLSRVGVVSFLLLVAFILFRLTVRMSGKFRNWLLDLHYIKKKLGSNLQIVSVLKVSLSVTLLVLFLLSYISAALGMIFVGARFDPRLARMIKYNPIAAGGFYEAANTMAIAERVVYWKTGLDIFGDHPWLGVGLGNAGFYFPDKMPAFGWALWEISTIFNYRSFLPNTKSLWIRILAEKGLVGFGVFLAWLFLLWKSGKLAYNSKEPMLKMLGLAGQFTLICFLIEGFSIDSFALPYFWFAMGILSAAAFLTRQSLSRFE